MDRTDMTHRMYDIKGPLVAKNLKPAALRLYTVRP